MITVRTLIRRFSRLNVQRGSKYEKIPLSALDIFSIVKDLSTYYEAYQVWREWREGLEAIAYSYVSPHLRGKLLGLAEETEESVQRDVYDMLVAEFRRRAPRWRPAFAKVLGFLVENPDFIGDYYREPHPTYRRIAEALGLSFSTVRDAFWALRGAGLI